ncbi:nucleotidyl transferase AbiEii/AbiGii toxin family protein [Hamadaea sp. NPDC050747]|uniref:nucleotidyl transferase AbiEii/AbiGii toxin family protein n=1 Tax=Hamadaea sp. NPDC050747 TaxID=3155789 RepID=UPI0033E870A4
MTPAEQAAIERIALTTAAPWGFALGGGRALLAYGVTERPSEGVDLFTVDDSSVRPAAEAVMDALAEAGFSVWEVGDETDLFDDLADILIELTVSGHDGASMPVSLGVQPRSLPPVDLGAGPVTPLEDLAAIKVAAMVNRAEVRDFIDVAAFLRRFDRDQLLALVTAVDPALTADDYAACVRQLDCCPDERIRRYGADPLAVRAAFADWPRD